jgi:hypothetical protein
MNFFDGGEMHDGDLEGVRLWLVLGIDVSRCGRAYLQPNERGAQKKYGE